MVAGPSVTDSSRSVASADARRPDGAEDGTVAEAPAESCRMDVGLPRVAVAVEHHALRSLIVDLLCVECGCWAVCSVSVLSRPAVVAAEPDLLVVDTNGFAACCRGVVGRFPLNRVVVIGPEPDAAYEFAALNQGAGAWLSGDHVAEKLGGSLLATHAAAALITDRGRFR